MFFVRVNFQLSPIENVFNFIVLLTHIFRVERYKFKVLQNKNTRIYIEAFLSYLIHNFF